MSYEKLEAHDFSSRPPRLGRGSLSPASASPALSFTSATRGRTAVLLKRTILGIGCLLLLHYLAGGTRVHQVYENVHSLVQKTSRNGLQRHGTVPITRLSTTRRTSEDPPPVHLTESNDMYIAAAVVMDQRSTWQEGGRTPYFVQFILYWHLKDAEWDAKMDMMLQVNASYVDFPELAPVRCRPWSTTSNEPLVPEKMHYDQPPHHIDCDIPIEIASELTSAPSKLSMKLNWRALEVATNELREQLIEARQQNGDDFDWPEDLVSPPSVSTLQLNQYNVPKTTYSICLTPFRNFDDYLDGERPHRFIEWRAYWKRLGVERVVWFAYEGEESYVAFAEQLSKLLGVQDEVHVVKRMVHPFPYWDQPLYYGVCTSLYRKASDYLIVVDLDEMIMLEPSEYADPAAGFKRWLDSWPDNLGGYAMKRTDLSMTKEGFERSLEVDGPGPEVLAQDLWTTVQPNPELQAGYLKKSIYRAEAPERIWTHFATAMYPLPEPKNEALSVNWIWWPKPVSFEKHENWWEFLNWPTMDVETPGYWDVWPRMVHCRWWGGQPAGEIGSEDWPTSPERERFKDDLRAEVLAIGEKMSE